MFRLGTMDMRILREYRVPITLVILGACSLFLDVPIARFLMRYRAPGDAAEVLTVAETFGHGVGAGLALLLVWVLGPTHLRLTIHRLFVASLGAGLAADVIKLLVSRTRPNALGAEIDAFAGTFVSWFPLLTGTSAVQSFPSAHAATAAGLAIGLSTWFPKGRTLFLALATLTCASRMCVGAHYLSDVLVGAALGIVVARVAVAPSVSTDADTEELAKPIILRPFEKSVAIKKAA